MWSGTEADTFKEASPSLRQQPNEGSNLPTANNGRVEWEAGPPVKERGESGVWKSRASIWVHLCATKETILIPKKSRGKEIVGI